MSELQDELATALAGTARMHDHLAQSGDQRGLDIALLTVDALNAACQSIVVRSTGAAILGSVNGTLPKLGFR